MTKPTNEPTDVSNGHQTDTPTTNVGEPAAPQRHPNEMQLRAFKDLARRIHTSLSTQRFEAALHALLVPLEKKKTSHASSTAQAPTSSPES